MADIARRELRSWRDLPSTLFQIQTKFRDEPRPRGGIIRTREFIMFDAYTFDRDEDGMETAYQKQKGAYIAAFNRMQLPFVIAEADGGAIGDLDNHEFVTLSEVGEDTILLCPKCNYAANAERCAVVLPESEAPSNGEKPLEIIATPGVGTIADVAGFLGTSPENFVKTLLFIADGSPIAVLVRGDRDVNEIKLLRYLKAKNLHLADEATVQKITNAAVGFAGPVGLNGTRIVADNEVRAMRNFITGANQSDAHYVHVNIGRDFTPEVFADLRLAVAGDLCPACKDAPLEDRRGVEVGHIFKLGDKYSGAMGANYNDESGELRPILMGSYGIGIGRTMAAIIETSHDANGIIWPAAIAPFEAVIVVANVRDEATLNAGLELHDALKAKGVDILLDDRDERAGVKFKDADLIGYPVRIVIGKGFANGQIEIRTRKDAATVREVPVADAPETVIALLNDLKKTL